MSLAAECIVEYELDRTEQVLIPIITALGGKFKKGRLSSRQKRAKRRRSSRRRRSMNKQERGQARDWHNFMSAMRYGIRYVDMKDGEEVGRTQMAPPIARDTLHGEGGE